MTATPSRCMSRSSSAKRAPAAVSPSSSQSWCRIRVSGHVNRYAKILWVAADTFSAHTAHKLNTTIHSCIHTIIQTHNHYINIHTYIHTFVYIHTCAHTYKHIHTVYTYIQYIHNTCIHTYLLILQDSISK